MKSHTEYTGPESYVQKQIDQDSTEWFPWLRAMSLRKSEDEDDTEQTEFQEIKQVLRDLSKQMDVLHERYSGLEAKFSDRGALGRAPPRRGTVKFAAIAAQNMKMSQRF